MKDLIIRKMQEGAFVVGEQTTEDGPFLEDHFLVFVFASGDMVRVGVSSDEAVYLIAELKNRLGCEVKFKLCNCAENNSRIIYPDFMRELPLFSISPPSRRTIRNWFLKEVEVDLSPNVKGYLENK